MDNFKGENPESPEDILQKIPVLSSYAKGLENHIKERYLKKISVVEVDPAALPSEHAVESRMLASYRSLRLALVLSSRDKPLHE